MKDDHTEGSHFNWNTNDINCLLLNHFLDFLQRNKWKPLLLDLIVIFHFLNIGISVKCQTVVILDRGELLIGKLDRASWKQIDFVFFQSRGKLVDCISKECGLNLGSFFIDELNVHEDTFSFLVLPLFLISFLCNPCSDSPVHRKLV